MADSKLTDAAWRKSSFSGGGGNCVELAPFGDEIGVRDSKDPTGPILRFTRSELLAFLDGAKAGEFDSLTV